MRYVAVLALLAFFQEDTGEQFVKFKVGAYFLYNQKRASGQVDTLEFTVTKVDEGKEGRTYLDMTTTAGKTKKDDKAVWWVEGGQVIWGGIKDGATVPGMWLYKAGAKQGDTWKPGTDPGTDIEMKHMGTKETKVPNGTYKDAIFIKATRAQGCVNVYLVPNIGVIKIEYETIEGKIVKTVELAKFKDGAK